MMRGASADGFAATERALEAGAGSQDWALTGQDLFGVAALLRAEPALRRVATDVAVPAPAKAGLLRDVLGSSVTQAAMVVAETAVGQRWTAARDLADALEQLGVIAVVRSTRDEAGRLEDELFAFSQAVHDNAALRDALSDPARSVADKGVLLDSLLEGKALAATSILARQAISGSYRTPGIALTEYQKAAAEARNQRLATVRVSKPLSEADTERLRQVLSRRYDRNVHLNVVVDRTVIGGLRVETGDDVIDGTVASRLDTARRKIAG